IDEDVEHPVRPPQLRQRLPAFLFVVSFLDDPGQFLHRLRQRCARRRFVAHSSSSLYGANFRILDRSSSSVASFATILISLSYSRTTALTSSAVHWSFFIASANIL